MTKMIELGSPQCFIANCAQVPLYRGSLFDLPVWACTQHRNYLTQRPIPRDDDPPLQQATDGGPNPLYDVATESVFEFKVFNSAKNIYTDEDKIELLLGEVLKLLKHAEDDEETKDTPRRVARMLQEFHQRPSDQELREILKDGFKNPSATGAMVAQHNIPFRGMCAHHLAPFIGTASIGYIPSQRVVGLSKLTRLTQAVGTSYPSTQEAITNTIADILHSQAGSLGTIVVSRALHTCMSARGVNAPNVYTTVSALRGVLLTNPAARSEFFDLIRDQ